MKLNKKITLFIALLALFYCVSLIQNTYAKYLTSADAKTDIAIARWNILINNQDVVANSNFTESLSPVFEGSDHISSGVIAPNAVGYFDLIIDGSQTDVSFTYTISIEESENNTISDFNITGYEIEDTLYTYNDNITGDILLSDTNRTSTIRVYVEWLDGTGETMNNQADTLASSSGIAEYKVNVNLIQLNN